MLPQNQLICRYISGDFARQRTPNHEKHSGEVQEGADSPCLQLGKGILKNPVRITADGGCYPELKM